MNDILVHNNWDPLEEIWLGDVYPCSFYDDLNSEVRDNFCKITEWTKEDLAIIEKKFKEFNVIVRRPEIKDKSNYIDSKLKKLIKPPICPRDDNAVIGNKLYYGTGYGGCYIDLASHYQSPKVAQSMTAPNSTFVSGAGLVKLGRDLIFDFMIDAKNKQSLFEHFKIFSTFAKEYESDYRIHYATNDGHTDGCFMPLRPGLVITTKYFKEYDLTLPSYWENIHIYEPTYVKENTTKIKIGQSQFLNYKWRLPHLSNVLFFNKHLEKYCADWIGNYRETFFEVNVVMIDENNMMCIDTSDGKHQPLFEILSKKGINVHVVPWRTKTFWDGGLHCITLDVRRKATKKDYFPERGDNGIKTVISQYNDNNLDRFYIEYNKWLKNS